MKITLIVHIRKIVHGVSGINEPQQLVNRKNTVCIEFDSRGPQGNGEVKYAPRRQQSIQIVPPTQKPIGAHLIAVSAKPKVLQSMKTGERIATTMVGRRQFSHQVKLSETDIGDRGRKWSDVNHFDFSKACDMSHETINTRSDIKMAARGCLKNVTGGPEVLVKVGATGCTSLQKSVRWARTGGAASEGETC